ncbi:MAG: hypothetical protein CSA34_02080 [Desulfobulbus propionicus]|nr:MAG: hypothetical protein CSA34_02080 [Desulfobulbus propionicus]
MQRLRYLPVMMVMGSIFFLSHQPGDSFAQLPGFPGLDKLVHAGIYAVLAWASCLAHPDSSSGLRHGLQITAFCLLYGISDEFHQAFVPHRSPSLLDLGADGLGASFAVVLWHRWRRRHLRGLSL